MSKFTIATALVAFTICGVAAIPQIPTDDVGRPTGSISDAPASSATVSNGGDYPGPSATAPWPGNNDTEANFPGIILPPALVIGSCFPVEFLHNSSLVPFYVPAFNDTGFFLDFNANGTTIGSNVTACSEFPFITSGLVPIPSATASGGVSDRTDGTVSAPTPAPTGSINARQVLDPSSSTDSAITRPAPAPTGSVAVPILVPPPSTISLNGTVNGTVPLPGLACFYFVHLNGTGCIPLCGAEANTTWNGTNFIKHDDSKPTDGVVGTGVTAGSILGLIIAAILAVVV